MSSRAPSPLPCLLLLAACERVPAVDDAPPRPVAGSKGDPPAASASARPPSTSPYGLMHASVDVARPPPMVADVPGCFDLPSTVDFRRPLEREVGVASPEEQRFDGSPGFFLVQDPEVVPLPGSSTVAGLRLRIDGKAPPEARAFLQLTSAWTLDAEARSAVTMKPVDGSIEGYRGPMWQLLARDRSTKRLYRWSYDNRHSCGNVAEITAGDYLELVPGQTVPTGFTTSEEENFVQLPRGSFDVWVVYRFCGLPEPSNLLSAPITKWDVLRDDVTLGAVASNVLRIEVP